MGVVERYEENLKKKETSKEAKPFYGVEYRYYASSAEDVAKDIINRTNIWTQNHNNYINNFSSRYEGDNNSYRNDSDDWLSQITTQNENFKSEAESIKSLLNRYADYFDPKMVEEITKALDSGLGYQSEIVNFSTSDRDYWKQWGTEDEYKEYLSYKDLYSDYKEALKNDPTIGMSGYNQYIKDREAEAQKNFDGERDINNDGQVKWWEHALYFLAGSGGGPTDTTLPTHMSTQVINDVRAYGIPLDTSTWTDEQKAYFGYLYTQNPSKALAIGEHINVVNHEKVINEIFKSSSTNFWGNSAKALLGSLTGLVDYTQDLTIANATGEIKTNGIVTPYEYSQAVISGNVQYLNNKYGTINGNVPIFGDKGVGDLYSLGMSIAQSSLSSAIGGGWGSLVMLGGSAAASGVDDALARGATDGQAIAYGGLVGLAEGVAEKMGIDHLGELVFKKGASASLKNIFKGIASQAFSEGLEEGATSIIDTFADRLIMGDKSNFNILVEQYISEGMSESEAKKKAWLKFAEDVAADVIGGALSGGVHAGMASVSPMVYNQIQGKNFKTKGDVNRLANYVKENGDTIFSADSVAYKLAGKVNEKTSAYKIGILLNEVNATITEQNKADIVKSLERKGIAKKVAEEYADTIAKLVAGHKLEQWQVDSLKSNEAVSKTLNEVIINPNHTVNQRIAGYNEAVKMVKAENASTTAEGAKVIDSSAEGNIVSEDGNKEVSEARTTYNGEAVEIAGVSSIKNGNVIVRLNNGSEVNVRDVEFKNEKEALVYEAVANMNEKTAIDFIDGFNNGNIGNGQSISFEQYLRGFNEAYMNGLVGMPANYVSKGGFAIELSEEQRKLAYQRGRIDGTTKVENQQKAKDEQRATVSKTENTEKKKGKVFYDSINKKTLTSRQKASIKALEKVAEALGVDIHLFESEVNEKGEHIGENGSYDPTTNTIRIDIHAGVKGEGLMLFTAAHELTHFIKEWSPAKFKVFADFLLEQYATRGIPLETLIQNQIKKGEAKNRWEGKTETEIYELAYEEVVADSCEAMLTDSNALEKLALLRNKDKGLFNKIKKFITDLVAKIKNVYKGLKPDSAEANYVRDMVDAAEQLQALWTEALLDAGEAYSTTSSDGNIDLDGNENVHFSDRSMIEGAGLQFIANANGVYKVLDKNGKPVKSVTAEQIVNSPLGNLVTMAKNEGFLGKGKEATLAAKKQYEFLAELVNMCINYNGLAPIWETAGTMVFSSMKSNADKQYGLTIDFSTVCKKTQAIVDAMSEAMLRLGRGLSRKEVETIYLEVGKAGESTPCPVCYVFSRWMGIGGILDQISQFQDKYSSMSEKSLQKFIADIQARINERANTPDKNGKLKSKFFNAKGEVSEGQVIAELKNKASSKAASALNAIAKNSDIKLEIQELEALMENQTSKEAKKTAKKIDKLKNKLADVSSLEKEVSAADDELEEYEAYQWLTRTLMTQSEGKWVKNSAFKPVPKEILFDLNKGDKFAEGYPLSWAFRTGKGASAGKAIVPYADARVGEAIQAVANQSPKDIKIGLELNPFLNADTAGRLKILKSAIVKQARQNLVGGQRYQSTSDFRYEYGSDYLITFLEMQAIGAKVQLYTKVIEAVDFLASMGADINLSVMPLSDGFIILPNGEKKLVYSSVTGINAEVAIKKSQEYNNVQLILVGISDEHIRLALAGTDVTFVIPFHGSGNSVHQIQALMKLLNENLDVTTAQDYTAVQSDHVSPNQTKEQKAMWDLRVKIVQGKASKLTAAEQALLDKNAYLKDLYRRFYLDQNAEEYGVGLTSGQAEQIFPYEYWDKSLTYAEADKNGERFKDYCASMGIIPRFSGKNSKGEDVGFGNFTNDKGYWKLLIDRPMYDNTYDADGNWTGYGKYHVQQRINCSNFKVEHIDPEYGSATFGDVMSKANDPKKTNKIVDAALAQFGKDTKYSDRGNSWRDVDKIQGLESYTVEEVSDIVRQHIESLAMDMGEEISIIDIRPYGSRARGTAKNTSDLDVVVQYEGDIREDDMFNMLNDEDKLVIDGIEVDINPIKADDTGTIEEYLDRVYGYDKYSETKFSDRDSAGNSLSKEQQEYFKDSKVRDKDGNLIPMYHGTHEKFTVFDISKTSDINKLGKGHYFTSSLEDANKHYTKAGGNQSEWNDTDTKIESMAYDLFYERGYDYEDSLTSDPEIVEILDECYRQAEEYYSEKNATLMSTYLNLKNPLFVKKGEEVGSVLSSVFVDSNNRIVDINTSNILNSEYDGIIDTTVAESFQGVPKGTIHVVAFDSNQIKLTTNKTPTSNPDIRYSDRDSDGNVLTEEQKNYFKDSKVRDKDGRLLQVYHGTPNEDFTVFDKNRVGKGNDQYGAGFYFATDKEASSHYGKRVIESYLDIKKPIKIKNGVSNLIEAGITLTSKQAYEVVKRLPDIYDNENSVLGDYYDSYWESGAEEWMIRDLAEKYREVGYLDSDLFRNYPNELHEALRDVVGYDGVEVSFDSGEKFYVAWFDNQMKLTSNLKPTTNPDIRYSDRVTDKETLDFLENQEHVTVYRAMQLIDGKLYPPMNAYTYDEEGKKVLVTASEIGAWEQAVERPDLIDPKTGKFKLDKGKVDGGKRGTIVPAAYNPYIHTSLSMLNDQFTSAYTRSNLVVVKGVVPKSELSSGYKAQYAKDSVGETEWHSGVVSTQLPESRKVILSRWFKPVEIVDNDVVAQNIKEMLGKTGIEIPYNVVSPKLRRSLEKIGVPIGEGRGIRNLPSKNEVMYSFREYTDKQKENWKSSKRILLYENEAQYRDFIKESRTNNLYNKKLYFGAITSELAALIKSNTGIDVEGFNCTLSAYEIRKMFKDHGNEQAENLRGQRAITEEDILNIPRVILSPTDIKKSPKLYNGKPVINFTKDINGKITVSAVVSDKHLDLFVQTAFVGIKKGNLATPIDEQASINTPKASSGTVSDKIVPQKTESVNTNSKNSQKLSDRDTDSMSNRSLLANALEATVQNDIEKIKLETYKQKIILLNAEERKLQNINKQIRDISFSEGARDNAKLKDLKFEANQIANRINTYDRQLLNLEASKPLKNVLEREKKKAYKKAEQRGKEALDAYRERSAKTTRELMNRYQESRSKATEGRHKTEMRHKIKKVVGELNKLLLRPTKDKHVQEDLQKAVAESLFVINMDSLGAEERVARINELIAKETNPDTIADLTATRDRISLWGENLKDKLSALQAAYEKIRNSKDVEMVNAYQEVVLNTIKNVSEMVGDVPIRHMSLEQLEAVYEMYAMVLHVVRASNKAFKAKKGETITQLSESVNDEIRKVSKEKFTRNPITAYFRKIGWTLLKPLTAFRTIGSETFTDMYKELRNGEDTYFVDIDEAKAFIQGTYKKFNYNSWDKKQTKTFTAKSGKTFTLNLEQMMSIYAYSRREQALAHILEGGIVLEDAVIETKKHGLPIKYQVDTKTAFNISEGTLVEIVNSLTNEQKGFVEEMQAYLSDVMGAKGNEISMELLGIKLFKEKYYFPLKSSKYYMGFKPEEAGEIKLKNSSFSKETVQHANNPVVLQDFTDVWATHINDMSMYHAFVLPLEDFTRVFNYKTKTDSLTETISTEATIANAYGVGATQYIRNFLKSLNGGVRVDGVAISDKMIGLAKKGAVLGSASVIIQQPSAMMRAMALINPIHFATTTHKSLNIVKHKQDWAELKQYAPIAGIKEMGRFDVGMGQTTVKWIKDQNTAMEKVDEALGKAPAFMDEITWVGIWNAVKKETASKHKDLQVDSEAFLKKAGERFTEVVSLTQVYDSVFSRSDIMRNANPVAKMLTAFMAEPTTTLNMLWDAFIQGKRTGKAGGFIKMTAGTGGAVLGSIVFNAALKSIIMAMRDDDDDESYVEKYFEHFVGDLKDNLNPLSLIPFVKDIVSIFNGYDVERMDMALFSDLKNAIDAFDSDSKTEYEKWSGLVGAISAFFGVPIKNVERDVRGAYNTIKSFIEGEKTTGAGIKEAIKEGWTGEKTSNAQQLYEAILSGDQAQIDRVKGRFEDQDAINAAIRKALRDNDPRIREAAQARYNGDIATYKRIAKEIIAEGYFDQDTVVAAINAEINAIKREEAEGTTKEPTEDKADEATSIYSASDVNAAFENGDTAMAKEVIADIVNTKMANGKTEKEAKASVRSSMTAYWKPLYKAAYQNNDTAEMKRIREILYASGLYGGANLVVETVKGWLKD